MFSKVLLARESISCAAVTVGVRAHERFLGVSIFLVYFALVAKETPRVGESLDFVTTRFVAFIGTVMFVHMFAKASVST